MALFGRRLERRGGLAFERRDIAAIKGIGLGLGERYEPDAMGAVEARANRRR